MPGPIDYGQLAKMLMGGTQQVAWDPTRNRKIVDSILGTEGARGAVGGGGGRALYKGQFTREQAEKNLAFYRHQLHSIDKTTVDPIEQRRNPEMVKHLRGQAESLRLEMKAIEDFLAK